MTFEEALEELSFHCGRNPSVDDPRWGEGFLQTLRPFKGLRHDRYEHLMTCVSAVSGHLLENDCLNREVMNSLWAINYWSRAWCLHEDGMVVRNHLISNAEQVLLQSWLDELARRVAWLLDGALPPPA